MQSAQFASLPRRAQECENFAETHVVLHGTGPQRIGSPFSPLNQTEFSPGYGPAVRFHGCLGWDARKQLVFVLRGHPNPANEGHLKTGQR